MTDIDERPRGQIHLPAPLTPELLALVVDLADGVELGQPATLPDGTLVYEHPLLDADTVEVIQILAANPGLVPPELAARGRVMPRDWLIETVARAKAKGDPAKVRLTAAERRAVRDARDARKAEREAERAARQAEREARQASLGVNRVQ